MPSRTIRRLVPFALVLALILSPVSYAAATPWSLDAPAVQATDDGGAFSWITGWLQGLVSGSDSVAVQVEGADSLGFGAPDPDNGLSSDEEEEERSPAINVEGQK